MARFTSVGTASRTPASRDESRGRESHGHEVGRLWALLRAGALLDRMPGAVELAEDDYPRLAARTRQH
jgi:hypothetical protein